MSFVCNQFDFDDVLDETVSPPHRTSFVRSKPDEWSSALPKPSRHAPGTVRRSLDPPPKPPSAKKAPPPLVMKKQAAASGVKIPRKQMNFAVDEPVKPVNLFRGKGFGTTKPSTPIPARPPYIIKNNQQMREWAVWQLN